MVFTLSTSAGFLVNQMARLFERQLRERIEPLGLAPAQFATLVALCGEDGLTQKQLLARLDIEQATMANTLSRMERDGLIVRHPHPTDKRAQTVHLTDKARHLEDKAVSAAQLANAEALSGLGEDEKRQFMMLMAKVIATMRAD